MEWDLNAIRLHLPQYEDLILKIIPSECHMEDELVWLPERSGNYSTKSGYALWKANQLHTQGDFNWYSSIWQVKTSPKLKHFLWKIKSNALPVGSNLLRRGMEVEGRCKKCGLIETERHILFQCPFANRVWDLVPALFKPDPNLITSADSLLQASRRLTTLPPTGLNEAALYPWIFWYLWIGRNKFVLENRRISEQEVVMTALKEARIWQAAQKVKERSTQEKRISSPEMHNSLGTQCFVDAAWNAGTSGGGFGCIFKDCNGKFLHQVSSNRSNVGSVLVAEAFAVKAALKVARSLGLSNLIIRSDSKSLILAITSHERIIEAQGIIFDIYQLCNEFSSVAFCFIPRGNNAVADALAKAALRSLPTPV